MKRNMPGQSRKKWSGLCLLGMGHTELVALSATSLAKQSYLETIFEFLAHKIQSYWVYARIHGCQVDTDVIHEQQEAKAKENSVIKTRHLKTCKQHLSLRWAFLMPQSYISQWQGDICKEGGRPNAVVSGNPCARL